MRGLSLTDRMVDVAVSNESLLRVAPSVFRVRGAPQTERMAVIAATLASGGRAGRGTAASLLRLDAPVASAPIRIRLDVPKGGQPRFRRVAVETAARRFHPVTIHQCGPIGEPVVIVDGIACSDAPGTLIDLARELSGDDLEDAFERARRLGLVSATSLARRFELRGGRGRKGAAKVREVLAHTRPGVLDSKLEGKAWRMIRSSRVAEPVRQVRVDLPNGRWYRVDFAWPELLVAVEAEGFEWHGSRARWKADRIRVAALERLGWRVLIVTWDDVTMRPRETLDRIALALAERARLVVPS
ncbi:MAG: DUF559 domain-containing protein [Acidimicrobiia bacterium]